MPMISRPKKVAHLISNEPKKPSSVVSTRAPDSSALIESCFDSLVDAKSAKACALQVERNPQGTLEPVFAKFVSARGTDERSLEREDLIRELGAALHIEPNNLTQSAEDEEALEKGEWPFYTGEALRAILVVSDAINALSGTGPARLTVLPVVLNSLESGPILVPLFRVLGADGKVRFVDNVGRTYKDFLDWKMSNQLPPGEMTFPREGVLTKDAQMLETHNSPMTVDTFAEEVLLWSDRAALAGGLALGAVALVSTGGATFPLTSAALSLYTMGRAGNSLVEGSQHGQSMNPFKNDQAVVHWVGIGSAAVGLSSMGATSLAAHQMLSQGKVGAALANTAVAMSVANTGTSIGSIAQQSYTLVAHWDELPASQRMLIISQLAFQSGGLAKQVRLSGVKSLYSGQNVRDQLAIIDKARTDAIARAEQAKVFAARGPSTPAEEALAYKELNAALVGKYPTLDRVLKDPDGYMTDVKGRFTAQKSKTPDTPYQFDFSDYGIPVLKGLQKTLDAKIGQQTVQLAQLQKTADASVIAERKLGLDYLKMVKTEVSQHVAQGHISYQRLQELGYFSTRAMGHFDQESLGLRDRTFLVWDRALQSHKSVSMAQEIELFKTNQMQIFPGASIDSDFRAEQQPFLNAFSNKHSFDMLTLPTSEELGRDVFLRLAAHNIYLVGVSGDPIAADGFVRPGSDFWVHDNRHNAAIFSRMAAYEAENRMSVAQVEALQKQIDVWRVDLNHQIQRISDPDLKHAVEFVEFNYHHDRGIPMVPSSFTKEHVDVNPHLASLTLKFAHQAKAAKAVFSQGQQTLQQAYDWLRNFWLPRLPQEDQILGTQDISVLRSTSKLE